MMRKILLFIILFASTQYNSIYAQSTIYIVSSVRSFAKIPIKINGVEKFQLGGACKAMCYNKCTKKCLINQNGRVVLSYDFKSSPPTNTKIVYSHASEVQLNLSENSVHYIEIDFKGMTDYQFKEISEEDALKCINSKKYLKLNDYVEQ